ncbi:CHY zinc finger-domain-containing protein [Aspergillus spinulosporus]
MHYSKSYRWFRFGCCQKVFPCDKCHDAATDHPNEHANRMICGFCSREQIYRPENCGICRSYLIGKAGSGFWEGGKGTRNKTLMSRKDPRKYKRRPGSTPGGTSSSKKK